jgi:Aminotransferase class I and II
MFGARANCLGDTKSLKLRHFRPGYAAGYGLLGFARGDDQSERPERSRRQNVLRLSVQFAEHGIYIQPINYPTVPHGTEWLRITPTPYHNDAQIDALAGVLVDVWRRLGLPFQYRALAAE